MCGIYTLYGSMFTTQSWWPNMVIHIYYIPQVIDIITAHHCNYIASKLSLLTILFTCTCIIYYTKPHDWV